MTARPLRAAAIVALAFAASATSIDNGFTYDDRVIVAENERIHALGNVPRLFADTYWTEKNGAAAYRPVTLAAFAAQWAAGGGAPRIYHAVNVLLYAAVCLAVLALAGRILPPAAAWIAAALFAVHPVHVEAVGNIVGQAELIVALAAAAAVTLYLRDRQRGSLRASTAGAIAALYAVACLAKEHGLVLPGLLLAAELLIVGDARSARERLRELAPAAITLAAIGVAYLAARTAVLGQLVETPAHIGLAHASPQERMLTMLRVAPEWTRLLLWPARLSGDYSPREIEIATSLTPSVISGAAVVAGALLLIALSWRRRPVLAFGLAWTAIMLLPVSNLLVASGVALGERTLFSPSIGIVLAIGAIIALLAEVAARRRAGAPPDRRLIGVAAAAVAVLLALGAWRSAVRQRVWRDNDTFFRQLILDAPLSYRAHWAQGAMRFEAGDKVGGEEAMRTAIALFPRDANLLEDLASRYLRAGMCEPAIPLFRDVLAIVPDRQTARMGLVACLMLRGRVEEASTEARGGLRFPDQGGQLRRLAHTADSLANARRIAGSDTTAIPPGPHRR